DSLKPGENMACNASCTTNCLAPLIKPLHDAFGVEYGLMNTVHSFTNAQVLADAYHQDLRRARAAANNMITTTSGAIKALGRVLPAVNGKLDGSAVRVPTVTVSFIDLTLQVKHKTDATQVNQVLEQAARTRFKGVLEYCEQPLVSSDYNHNPASSIVDAPLTQALGGHLVKVCAWYDNE